MEPWHAVREPRRAEAFRELWPELDWENATWNEDGWDFLVAILSGGWVVRIPRTHGAAWRLQREMNLLRRLTETPVQLPAYRFIAPNLAAYPVLPGQPISAKHPADDRISRQLAGFLDWLHGERGLSPALGADEAWRRKARNVHRRIARDVLPLLTVKEGRRLACRFREFDESLAQGNWRTVLLHGDLVAEHVLENQGSLAGILDFGDWRWGDEAFDYSGVLGLEAYAPLRLKADPGFLIRVRWYRLAAIGHQVRHALKSGDVESSEQRIRVLRREI